MLTPKKCQRCGASYMGGALGRYCMACRKKISSEGATGRRLWELGANGRWHKDEKPQWIGPSAELLPEETQAAGRKEKTADKQCLSLQSESGGNG